METSLSPFYCFLPFISNASIAFGFFGAASTSTTPVA
jgi:hypothetical protein